MQIGCTARVLSVFCRSRCEVVQGRGLSTRAGHGGRKAAGRKVGLRMLSLVVGALGSPRTPREPQTAESKEGFACFALLGAPA